MTEQPRTFICRDCEIEVHAFAPDHANDQDLCVECKWLRAIEDPIEREQLRDFLNRRR